MRHFSYVFYFEGTMYLLKGFRHSPKDRHDYESVEDQKDLRIPVQNDDAFKHGIIYKAKVTYLQIS